MKNDEQATLHKLNMDVANYIEKQKRLKVQQGLSERAKNYRLHVYLDSMEQNVESDNERTLLSSR